MRRGTRQLQHFTGGGRAFTLIELLVVVGVMAILIGVLMPVLASARRSARIAQCASNMHQVGLALETYQAENRQTYPYAAFQRISGGTNSEISFDDLLHKHLDGGVLSASEMDAGASAKPMRTWQCPEDDRDRWFGNAVRTYVPTNTRIKNATGGAPQPGVTRLFTGFAGSEASNSPAPLLRLSIKQSELRNASQFITFVESPSAGNFQGSAYRSSCSGPEQQSAYMPRGQTLHRGKWNYLFADLHVALHDPADTTDMQFRKALPTAIAAASTPGADTQPGNLPPFRVPFVDPRTAPSIEYTWPTDNWWGGMWSGGGSAPKGAQPPRGIDPQEKP
jgi:prepilin-type N-terminal cleavage/methylation domain-containing protein/prepilin-type processing-associated H-X9-DG protein